ncbi:hypothetical protein GOODEAATRI_004120 [Goodea atripinnis]|uniref:Uncharacterized protein n=1 Tax=Goodea atripinnis TaxID=208336 RepID=A0ABV0NRM6_9TELE
MAKPWHSNLHGNNNSLNVFTVSAMVCVVSVLFCMCSDAHIPLFVPALLPQDKLLYIYSTHSQPVFFVDWIAQVLLALLVTMEHLSPRCRLSGAPFYCKAEGKSSPVWLEQSSNLSDKSRMSQTGVCVPAAVLCSAAERQSTGSAPWG